MVIIGLDQSTSMLGFSIFEDGKLKSYGVGGFDKYKGFDKVVQVKQQVIEIIDRYQPDKIFLEDVQFQRNPKIFKLLSKLLGVLEDLFCELEIPYEIVPSSVWRVKVGINSYRKKREQLKQDAIQMVKNKFFDIEQEDCCEGILIGWYGVLTS